MVRRYTKDRVNQKSWSLGALEEITVHQIWELDMEFMETMTTSYPRGVQLHWLRELFPGIQNDRFSLHTEISVHGGSCTNGDVVSVFVDDNLMVGELLQTVGVSGDKLYSFIALWDHDPKPSDTASWATYKVNDIVSRVETAALDTVLAYRMSASGSSAVVYIPFELRLDG